MRQRKKLESGSILELDYTSFQNSMELIRIISTIIQKDIPNFKIDSEFFKKDSEEIGEVLENILPIVLNAIGNEELIDTIIKCGDNSLINGERISKNYFETVENRKDFFLVLFEIAKYNIMPFIPQVAMK